MSAPSSPISTTAAGSVNLPSISQDALAAAAERRTRQATPQKTAAQLAVEHDKRQKFRRLVDPGITRPNPHDQALRSLKTLLAISENLIREPDNPKYQQFKPTNSVIKRDLVDRKGALEYAIELGFRPEVQDFQPYYTFHRRHMEDLTIGSAILKEYLAVEIEKQDRAEKAKKSEKAAKEAAAEKVKLAFMDDRKDKLMRDELERQQRAGRAIAAARQAAIDASTPRPRSATPENVMPGSGHILGLSIVDADEPMSSEHAEDHDTD